MANTNLPSSSRFRETKIIRRDGNNTFGLWKKPRFLTEEFDEEDIVKFEVDSTTVGRPDLIADAVYGNPELSWVVIAFNKPLDTINWPPTGAILRLPPSASVLSVL